MSEQNQDVENQEVVEKELDAEANELAALKKRADQMGITYHQNIGLEKLRERVNEKLQGKAPDTEESGVKTSSTEESAPLRRMRLRKEASKLRRVIITSMNPHKKEWEGEIFTVSNSVIGTIRRYVPFGVEWHIEEAIYKLLKNKEYQQFYWAKDEKTGQRVRKGKMTKEFSIVDLPALTKEELKKLADKQALAKAAEAN